MGPNSVPEYVCAALDTVDTANPRQVWVGYRNEEQQNSASVWLLPGCQGRRKRIWHLIGGHFNRPLAHHLTPSTLEAVKITPWRPAGAAMFCTPCLACLSVYILVCRSYLFGGNNNINLAQDYGGDLATLCLSSRL